jgi:hypothetical protein
MTDTSDAPVPPPDEHAADDERVVDLRPAVHEAGHEVEELGWAEVPDTSPVHAERRDGGNGEQIERDVEEMGSD